MRRRPPRPPLFPSTTLFRSASSSCAMASSASSSAASPSSPVAHRRARGRKRNPLKSNPQPYLYSRSFFINAPPTPATSPLPLHDALPICFVALRDGIERVVLGGIAFEPGGSPARL